MQNNVGIYASQISGHLYGGPYGAYDSLATVTVGAGGVASINFTGIPNGYKHLQLRISGQTSRGTYGNDYMSMMLNGNSSAVYSYHMLTGDGTSASSSGGGTQNNIYLSYKLGSTTSGAFGAYIIDILDYANANKYKTIRCLAGIDINGLISGYGGELQILSGSYQSTNAITSLTFTPGNANFTQYSSFALYGVK